LVVNHKNLRRRLEVGLFLAPSSPKKGILLKKFSKYQSVWCISIDHCRLSIAKDALARFVSLDQAVYARCCGPSRQKTKNRNVLCLSGMIDIKHHGSYERKIDGEQIYQIKKSNLHYTRLIPFRVSRVSCAQHRSFAPGPTLQG